MTILAPLAPIFRFRLENKVYPHQGVLIVQWPVSKTEQIIILTKFQPPMSLSALTAPILVYQLQNKLGHLVAKIKIGLVLQQCLNTNHEKVSVESTIIQSNLITNKTLNSGYHPVEATQKKGRPLLCSGLNKQIKLSSLNMAVFDKFYIETNFCDHKKNLGNPPKQSTTITKTTL